MNVLIIGGTGLISNAITRQLLARGDTVAHFNRGQREKLFSGQVRQIHGDRYNAADFVPRIHAAGPFDAIIDMITYKEPEARSLIDAARGRTPHVIFCSTVDVYAKPYHYYPIVESHPLGGLNDYARNKVHCETALRAAEAHGDFALTIIRPAQTYGEAAGLVNSFGWGNFMFARIKAGLPLIVHGDGTSLWAPCSNDDVARAFVGAAANPVSFGKSYHATGEEWMTFDQYYERMARGLGCRCPELVHIPSELLARTFPQHCGSDLDNFQFSNIFDNAAARRDLGFAYTLRFADGIRRMHAALQARNALEPADKIPAYDQAIAAWRETAEAYRARFATT